MYIRWVTRKHKSALSAPMVFHDAYLVESYRDEQGRPRQRTICYLGNLRQIADRIPPVESELFLSRASQILDGLALSSPVNCAEVMEQLRDQLPVLTPEAALGALTEQLGWFYEWWSQYGTTPAEEVIAGVVGSVLGTQERVR